MLRTTMTACAMASLTAATCGSVPPLPLPPLPDFSWDVVPRFVHCGPDYKPNVAGKPPRLPLTEIYRKMSTFPLATLEK